jgi:hypothetical protein
MMNSKEQKIDLCVGDLSINIDPSIVKTFSSLVNSANQQKDEEVY